MGHVAQTGTAAWLKNKQIEPLLHYLLTESFQELNYVHIINYCLWGIFSHANAIIIPTFYQTLTQVTNLVTNVQCGSPEVTITLLAVGKAMMSCHTAVTCPPHHIWFASGYINDQARLQSRISLNRNSQKIMWNEDIVISL